VTVEEGVDPRDHALVAMGGAGPTHAAEIADAIGIDRVIVPLHPGLTSAFGALAADVRVDEVKSVSLKSTTATASEVAALFDDLQATAVASFHAQGSTGEEPVTVRTIAMRYEGQNYEQEIPVPDSGLDDAMLELVLERYHELHHEFYGYRLDGLPVELVRLLVTATAAGSGALPSLSLDVRGRTAAPQDDEERTADVHFADGGFRPTPVVARNALAGTGTRTGPLIVESMDTTVVVPPGWTISGDDGGILDLRRSGDDTTTTTAGASQEARA
jgi:N-methylhydantoinase A